MRTPSIPIVILLLAFPAAAAAATYTDSDTQTFTEEGATTTFTFQNLPAADSDLQVAVSLWGEFENLDAIDRYADVDLDGVRTERMCSSGCSPNCNERPHTEQFQLAASSVSDGELVVTVDNSPNTGLCRETNNEVGVKFSYETNEPPSARDGELRTQEDTPADIELQASDPEGDPLTYTIVEPPSHGTLTGDAPQLTYEPDPDYFGNDLFRFEASDGPNTSNEATVEIVVEPVDDPPTWVAPDRERFEAVAGETFSVVAEATDPDGDTITYGTADKPNGSTLDATTGAFEWSPTLEDLGVHDVRFTATDGTTTIEKAVEIDVVRPDGADVADRADVAEFDAGDASDTASPDTSAQRPDTPADTEPETTYALRGGGCSHTPDTPLPTSALLLLLAIAGTRLHTPTHDDSSTHPP